MSRPEVAHRHRLHASYAAIVPDIGSGKAFHGIREGVYAGALKLVSADRLHRTRRPDGAVYATGGDLHSADMPHSAVQRVGRCLRANACRYRGERGGKHKYVHFMTMKKGISRGLPRNRMKHQ